jgi:hypothetical protein
MINWAVVQTIVAEDSVPAELQHFLSLELGLDEMPDPRLRYDR